MIEWSPHAYARQGEFHFEFPLILESYAELPAQKNPWIIRDTHPDECNQFRIHWHKKNNILKYNINTKEYSRSG